MLRKQIQDLGDVNELSSFSLTLSLTDDTGAAENPDTLEWRLVCIETGAELQTWTEVAPVLAYDAAGTLESVTATISVTGSLNGMRTTSLARERKALIVAADRGVAEWSTEGRYGVIRLEARS